MKQHDIVLLGNHGVLAVGSDLRAAMNKVEAAESIAKVLYFAERLGRSQTFRIPKCRCSWTSSRLRM